MLGIDKTTISRFKNMSDSFIKRVLHEEEIIEYNASENKELFLAARWAIKEALYKADNTNVEFSKMKITKENRQYKFPGYIISTTNEGDDYIAIVMKVK